MVVRWQALGTGWLLLAAALAWSCDPSPGDVAYGDCAPSAVDRADVSSLDTDTWAGGRVLACADDIWTRKECQECQTVCFSGQVEAGNAFGPILALEPEWSRGTFYGYEAVYVTDLTNLEARCGPVWVDGLCCYLVDAIVLSAP